ncbi:hypothetical protein K458DRAFT_416991 [Lentithecium fluviatile CBS 122367]|uniref:Uncharacterized protein n=1 Tax=Lentithecium fluviatile CBS 122367 TaxID=1168545 RepID=A0A6G1J5I2_9PLEO|nr:hypothetical protein K458DRAFT_416991 [Lentithecium fluviatile CBS 122367]
MARLRASCLEPLRSTPSGTRPIYGIHGAGPSQSPLQPRQLADLALGLHPHPDADMGPR